MLDKIIRLIHETINTGIGQSIIAFGAWAYVLILAIVFLCYFVKALIKYMFK